MEKLIKLDTYDIIQVIADHFDVNRKDVSLCVHIPKDNDCETLEPEVSVTIKE